MTVVQKQSRRKASGGFTTVNRKSRQYEAGRESTKPTIGKTKKSSIRTMGGNSKLRVLSYETANIYVPSEKKYKVAKISSVIENQANVNFVRRNILTKGTVIQTELGKAKITSRPGQDGVVNAVLTE